ncbi:DUF1697 domain-containing protein [Sphingobacterium deserti]|uniref:DUF1697 domain-containing protein n=1 Tax=Sphingobacterium deserti TaxID=1229276 RepID=A0A0B8SZQ2_9SPHI|nr:DUF1697 domain-containing protein [Sphingobacterium deserti]KGE13417.1 hypothetical protein DI53_2948 [Sphingobacterium deserti]
MKEQKQTTYIVLLRAVNVSGKNMIKMAELRQELQVAGFSNVITYIQSGNILLKSLEPADIVAGKVKVLIEDKFGLTLEVFVLDRSFLQKALDKIPIKGKLAPNHLFITVLNKEPDKALLEKVKAIDHADETFDIVENILYFYLPNGAARAKMSNNYFEKKLHVIATGRNLNTYQKLLELAENF